MSGRGALAVSVVIPAFNEERYVARCLRSLLAQTLDRSQYQVIVVDDGSSDKTAEIVKSFGRDVHLICNAQNIGLPASLNIAIRYSRTPFVVRVDADDYVNQSFLDILLKFLGANPEIDAVACDYLLVDDREEVISRKRSSEEPIACGIMFRTDQLIELGLYDETFLVHEDSDLRIRFLRKYSIHNVPLPLYRYRRHDSNITNDSAEMERHLGRLIEKHGLDNS